MANTENRRTTDALRTAASKLRQARRLVLRTELTLGALQATFWLALVVASVGAVLVLRRQLKRRASPPIADDPSAAVESPSPAETGMPA